MFVGDKEEFPMAKQRGKILSPRHKDFLELSGNVVESDEKLKSRLSPSERRCFFRDESKLTYFSKYTFSNFTSESLNLGTGRMLVY